MYIALLKLNMVKETEFLKLTNVVSLDIVVGAPPPSSTTITEGSESKIEKNSKSSIKEKTKKKSGKSMDLDVAEMGIVGVEFGMHGRVTDVVGVQIFNVEENALAIGKLPEGWK